MTEHTSPKRLETNPSPNPVSVPWGTPNLTRQACPEVPLQELGCWGSARRAGQWSGSAGPDLSVHQTAHLRVRISSHRPRRWGWGVGGSFLAEMGLLRASQEERMWKDGVQWGTSGRE